MAGHICDHFVVSQLVPLNCCYWNVTFWRLQSTCAGHASAITSGMSNDANLIWNIMPECRRGKGNYLFF